MLTVDMKSDEKRPTSFKYINREIRLIYDPAKKFGLFSIQFKHSAYNPVSGKSWYVIRGYEITAKMYHDLVDCFGTPKYILSPMVGGSLYIYDRSKL
jgi:hypothetical protein